MIRSRFWMPALFLVGFGLINVYSASVPIGMQNYGDPAYFFKRQVLWVLLALLAFAVTARVPLEFWRQIAPVLFLGLLAMLVVMKLTGIGVARNGAERWIRLGPLTLQPS